METTLNDTVKDAEKQMWGYGGEFQNHTDNSHLFYVLLLLSFLRSDLKPEHYKELIQRLDKIVDIQIECQKNKEKGEE